MAQYQEKISSSPASIEGPVKYGTLIVLGYKRGPNGDKARTKSPFALCQRPEANGVKPSTVHVGCDPQAATAICNKDQHSISYTLSKGNTVVVEYAPDTNTDMFQIGRSTETPIDFVVTDRRISRFACRIICQRSPPYAARIYAASFDSSKSIFLGEDAIKWKMPDGQMNGLTTNGVLVTRPLHGFNQDSKPGPWREISVCGDAYTLRETRWAQQQRKMVNGESQELVDGSLIDLCGVTLLWRTAEGLARTPTMEALCQELNAGRPWCPVVFNEGEKQPWAYLQCGHVHGSSEAEVEADGQERECPKCRVRGPLVPLQLGYEVGFFLDAASPTHAFVPCGHVCSEKTATFWSQLQLPHGKDGFHAACPFCVQQLAGDTGYIRLIWVGEGHTSVDNSENISPEDIKHQRVNELFSRLNLKHNYQNKLTTADFLKILPSIKKHDQITEEDIAHTFLHKLLMLDYRARYIPVTPIADEVITDYDMFSSTVDTSQSMTQSHVHPMDVQMAVFHCSDSFLRQNMITKLSQCQYALPLLVPDPFTRDIECPLWTFRQIRKAWKVTDKSGAITTKNMPIYQAETPMVSFFRLGSESPSKSQLINAIINDKHSTFFHRDCPGATKSHCLIDGMAEIAWYCPDGKPNDAFSDCVAFCNLHGDAASHEKQREILVKNASVNVVLVPKLGEGDKGKNILADLRKGPKPLICLLADSGCAAQKFGPGQYKMGLKNRGQAVVATELKEILRKLLSTPFTSFQLDTMACVSEIKTDEADPACQRGKSAALQILTLLEGKKLSEIKDTFLPCQGQLWHEWCKINKDQYRLKGDEKEKAKCKIESEMEQKRCDQRDKSSSQLMKLFIENLHSLEWTEKLYFLKWIGILLDNFSTDELYQINQAYAAKCSEVSALRKKRDLVQLKEKQTELERMSEKLQSATVGMEHILREIGQMYEAHASFKEKGDWSQYPKLAAELMIAGHPMELMDGDAAHVPLTWITSVLDEVIMTLEDKRVFVLSVLGIQSSGKSTMLNAMFGLQFAVSAGRCTRGAFMQLVKVSEEKQKDFQFDYVLVVDTEGLRALELAGKNTCQHDNELATFVIGLGNMTLINIFGENASEMQDTLHIVVQAFMRMKKVRMSTNCLFVHQNVTAIDTGKLKEGKKRLEEGLDKMTKLAAKEEVFDAEFFSDIIGFDVETDVKYFAQLWEGSPPMAPPNPGYSESIQELKDTILSKASQSRGMTFSQFKSTIEDIWNALLKENFVFSFKNTQEISLYRTLEEEYGKWTWALRKEMLIIENQLHTRIDNEKTIYKIQNELVNGMNKTREEVEEKMKKHFDDANDGLVQWRGRFETKIKEFHDELVKGAKQKLEEIIQQSDARRSLDDKKTVYENKLLQRSKELACELKDKANDEKELKRAFDGLWEGWVADFTAHIPSIKGIDIQKDVDSILQDMGIEGHLIDARRRCGNYKKITNLGNYSDYVILKGMVLKGEQLLGITEPLPYEKAKTFILNVMEQSIALIESKPVKTRGYSTGYLHEVAEKVINEVNEFDSDKTYALKPKFKVDLLLHVFQTAEHCLTSSHKEFKKNNDPLTYLEKIKDQYYNVFQGHCKGNSSAAVLGGLLCSKLKESATQAVYDKTAIHLAGEMKNCFPPFSGNRVNLEKHILQSLAEQADFDSYMNYIRDPKTHMETFIQETVQKYISNNHEKLCSIMQNHAEDVCRLLNQAVHEATQKVTTQNGDTDMWLKEFSTLLKDDLQFDTNCNGNFNDINHFDFLKDEIKKGLDSMRVDLTRLKINVVDVRKRPDQILIDQLCSCCWVGCPFCGAICTNTLKDHSPDDHNVRFHRPSGIDGAYIVGKPILAVTFCTTKVGGNENFIIRGQDKSMPFKEYRKGGPIYANWKITAEESKLPYWKWFVCQFQDDLEKHYGKRFAGSEEIPEEWKKHTREDAIESLKEL